MPSAAMELNFALYAVSKGKAPEYEGWNRVLFTAPDDLAGRVQRFWGPDAFIEWPEMMVLAWTTDTLFDSGCERFLAALESAAARPIEVPPLPTEGEHVEAIVASRLAELRASATRRREYAALLAEVWSIMRAEWDGGGLARAAGAARSLEGRLADGADITAIVPSTHLGRKERYAGMLREAFAAGELIVTPMSLTEQGQYIFAFPGMLVVGFGPEAARKAENRRERAERAANRFKVLSDPTRLALLGKIIHEPISVTDLAIYFELSQPTISVHVKLLREAGLLESERKGAQTVYRARPETVRQFVEAALIDVGDADQPC